MVKDIYEKWLNHPNLDPSYKEVLEQMDEGQINDAFYTTIEFGTAGMRGLLGPGTNRINLHTIRKANVGFAEYICANGEDAMKRGVAIGYDNLQVLLAAAFHGEVRHREGVIRQFFQ